MNGPQLIARIAELEERTAMLERKLADVEVGVRQARELVDMAERVRSLEDKAKTTTLGLRNRQERA